MALVEAERIVAAGGLDQLTARRVASGIGYTVGTLYLVFQNLDELVLHVNARTLDALHAEMRAVLASTAKPERAVPALALAYVRYATAHTNRWLAVYEHRLPEGETVPGWFQEKVLTSLGLVEQALATVAARRTATARAQAARALWGGVHGICMLGLTGILDVAGAGSIEHLVRALVRDYLRGFAAA